MKTEKLAILFNPSAGRGRALRNKEALEKCLRRHEIPYDLFITRSEEHLKELTRECARTYRALVGAGGDSTFHLMVNEIVRGGAEANFGLIGLGSSNDIAREFQAGTLEKACRILKRGRGRKIDLGCIRVGQKPLRYFLGQANIGLGVFVNKYVAEMSFRKSWMEKRQTLAGALGIIDSYRSRKLPLRLVVESERGRFEGELAAAVFSNVRFWATGKIICPGANPDDGLLDGCLIKRCSVPRLAQIALLASRGKHAMAKEVEILQSKIFEVASNESFEVQTDGEILGESGRPARFHRITFAVMPRALSLLS
ncbi:MAG: diacylglycerol kinase family protein [Candidatus Aminicenantales bacterium]